MIQFLPTYQHTFKNDKRWSKQETEHYVYYYFKDSEAHKNIDKIKNTQETGFNNIIKSLDIKVPHKKISYYFYPNKKVKKELMGDDWYAQAIISEFCVHVLYTKKVKPVGPHEDIHLLTSDWGDSVSFFEEGLAESFVGHAWDGKSHEFYVANGYKNKYYPKIRDFFVQQTWMDTDDNLAVYFYSLAASFTNFLIKKFGFDKYLDFYKKIKRENELKDNIEMFEKIFCVSIGDIENQFVNKIESSL